jgi:phage gp36-like protein
MAYATIADLENRITQARLATFVPEVGATRTELLTAMLARADALIDGYIGAVYATPAPASGLLQGWTLIACVYEIYLTRGGPEIPEKIKDSFEALMTDLRAVADGKRQIGGATPPNAGGAAGARVVVGSDDATLGALSAW